MRGVRVLHKEVVIADDRHFSVLTPAMDGGAFAKHVAVADAHFARAAGIGDVLRLIANHYIRMKHIALADFSIAEDRDVADKPGTLADANRALKQTERADLHPVSQLNCIANDGTGMNGRGRSSAVQLRCLLFFSASVLRSSSGCSVSSTIFPATRYFSLAQVPRSIIWHRSEQNGRKRLAGVMSTGFLQIAHRILMRRCQISPRLATSLRRRRCWCRPRCRRRDGRSRCESHKTASSYSRSVDLARDLCIPY